jgi:hypothetical protein
MATTHIWVMSAVARCAKIKAWIVEQIVPLPIEPRCLPGTRGFSTSARASGQAGCFLFRMMAFPEPMFAKRDSQKKRAATDAGRHH